MAFSKTHSTFGAVLLAFTALACGADALVINHIPIPATSDSIGFAMGNISAPVKVEAFFDLLCGDCKHVYPIFKSVIDSYGPEKIRLIVHLFALPYHHNAFYAVKSTYAITGLKPSGSNATYETFSKWMEACYDQQSMFSDAATINMTAASVLRQFAEFANNITGISTDTFNARMSDPNNDAAARTAWKYACGRAVTSTPSFFVNGGAIYSTGDSAWTVQDFKTVIDPLLNNRRYSDL